MDVAQDQRRMISMSARGESSEESDNEKLPPDDSSTGLNLIPEDDETLPELIPEDDGTLPDLIPEDDGTLPVGEPTIEMGNPLMEMEEPQPEAEVSVEPPAELRSAPEEEGLAIEPQVEYLSDDYEMESEDPALFPEEGGIDISLIKLDNLQKSVDRLLQEFENKLKIDQHKEKIIDHLHQELQEYKNDLIKNSLQSMVMDIIKVADDIRKFLSHHHSHELTAESALKIHKYLKNLPSDLEDVFSWHGIKPFTCVGLEVDTKKQRVVKKIPTSDESLDKSVVESLRPGYEWDGKIIRPELVSVFIYKK
jgi:molecular chaperone GrpE (heat shock protein)